MATSPNEHGQPDLVRCPQDLPEVCEILDSSFAGSLDYSSRMMLHDVRRIGQLGGAAWQIGRAVRIVNAEEWINGVVWREDGRVAGYASLTARPGERNTWVLANVAVHPERRKHGVGRGLVQFALLRVRALGGRRVYLQVDAENRTAEHIYEELGFREIGRRITWVHNANDRLLQPSGVEGVKLCMARRRQPGEWKAEYAFLQVAAPNGIIWNLPLSREQVQPPIWRQIGMAISGERQTHFLAFRDGKPGAVLILRENYLGWEGLLFSPGEAEFPCALELVRTAFGNSPFDRAGVLETGPEIPADALPKLGFIRRRTLIWMRWDAQESQAPAGG